MLSKTQRSLAVLFLLLVPGATCFAAAPEVGSLVAFDSARVTDGVPQSRFDEIVSLRFRINDRNEIKLLRKNYIRGEWENTRIIPVGTRLYYEVVDYSGNVVARGFRKDPRTMTQAQNVDFLLTAPYNADCASVNLYVVDYENGGRDGYSRNYSLLGSFDIRARRATASVD